MRVIDRHDGKRIGAPAEVAEAVGDHGRRKFLDELDHRPATDVRSIPCRRLQVARKLLVEILAPLLQEKPVGALGHVRSDPLLEERGGMKPDRLRCAEDAFGRLRPYRMPLVEDPVDRRRADARTGGDFSDGGRGRHAVM